MITLSSIPIASGLLYNNDTMLWDTDGSWEGWMLTHQVGGSVDIVGDLNGDGFDDFVIAAHWANGATGKVYIFFGGTSGWTINDTIDNADASYVGEVWGDQAGSDIMGAGDVNGDGYDDLLIAAAGSDEVYSDAFQTYVIFGRPDNWTVDNSLVNASASFIGEGQAHQAGSSLAAAGDVNGDGFDDILIGAPNNREFGNDNGQAYLIFGKASGWTKDTILSNADASFRAEPFTNAHGHEVAGLGDVNGDGFDDFATTSHTGLSSTGITYIWFGKPSGWKMDTGAWEADASFKGEMEDTLSGNSVSGAGDLNGDGLSDFIIGAPKFSTTNPEVGKVYVIFGTEDEDFWTTHMVLDNATASYLGVGATDHLGFDVEVVGDVDGDGYSDFITVAPKNDESALNAGQVYLYLGKGSGWQTNVSADDSDASFLGEETGDGEFDTYDLGGGGDVNGDGLDDFIIGSKGNVGVMDRTGKSWIIIPDSNIQPTTIGSVQVYSDPGYTQPTTTARVYETVYIEMAATDLDPARANIAIVNVTNEMDTRLPFRLRLKETGDNTGNFQGKLTIWNRTSKKDMWIGAQAQDTVNIYSIKDQTKNETLTIDWSLPRIMPLTDNRTATEGSQYLESYWIFGGKPSTSWDVTIDKNWLTWDDATGTLNGTPDNGDVGPTSVKIIANDGAGESATRAFTIDVQNVAPEIITDDIIVATEDEYYEVDYNSTDDGNGTISWSMDPSIPWLSLNATEGILNGTPTNDHVGIYNITITVDDGNGGQDQHVFNLTVTNVNDLPIITSTPGNDATEFVEYMYQVEAFDLDLNTTLVFGLDENPSGMAIDSNLGLVNWTPAPEQGGNNTVVVNVSDGHGGWNIQGFNVTVEVFPPWVNLSSPLNGSVVTRSRPTLNWTGTDLNSPVIMYDLYFGKEEADVRALDPSYREVKSSVENSFNLTSDLIPGETYYWTVIPKDGHHTGICNDGVWSFNVTGALGNSLPEITSEDETTAYIGQSYSYEVEATDADSGTILEFGLVQGPEGMTIDTWTGEITWIPTDQQRGNHTIIINVSDQWTTVEHQFIIEVLAPYINHAPTIRNIDPQKIKAGNTFTFEVRANDSDLDVNLTYGLTTKPTGMTIDPETGFIQWTPAKSQTGEHKVTVQVSDGLLTTEENFTITVTAADPTTGGFLGLDLTMLMLFLIMIIIAIVVAVAVVTRSRGRDRKAQAQATAAIATQLQQVKAQITEEKEMVDDFHIEGAFLIYDDGRLVSKSMMKESQIDDHLFGSMLIAIQGFVKESFQADSGLDSFEFSGQRVVLIKGRFLFLVVSLTGAEPSILREEMRTILERVEGTYAGVIEEWDGDMSRFTGAESMLAPLFTLKDKLRVKRPKDIIRVMSALEFYEGYVRLKVAVINKTRTTITDSSLNLTYSREALRFDKIEPVLPHEGTNVQIGVIKPGEKKTIAYFLDPLICQESYVDCTLTYIDYQGQLNHVNMKRRPVDIVCPIFYTPSTVNVAMLKRLLDDLSYHDSKIFRIKDFEALKLAYKEARDVVASHDIKFIREYKEDQPFEAESWYYGEVSVTDEKMVIRVAARIEKGFLEFYIASSNLASITGLLSELGHEIAKRFSMQGLTDQTVALETDLNVKNEVEKTRLLLDKYAESEMAPDETGQ